MSDQRVSRFSGRGANLLGRGVVESGVCTFACQYIVSSRGQTGTSSELLGNLWTALRSRAAKRRGGGGSNGGVSRSELVLPFLSFFVLFGTFPGIFPICSGMVRDFPDRPFPLSRPIRAPTRNSPERVRDTIWTFPKKRWETPGFGNPPGLASPSTVMRSTFSHDRLQLQLVCA